MAFERKLYVIRRRLHKETEDSQGCYVVSLSSKTVIYKGLLKGRQLARFYPDLRDRNFASAISLVHERFSTNTLGSWELAHPYRFIAHNGEINTIRGNVNWMRARESRLRSELFGDDLGKLSPVIMPGQSDSAAFDNALELLHLAGRSLPHAVAMMIPEAWENDDLMDDDRRAFYQYHSALMEPWDGPAAVAFTDGRLVGATLDSNGLRPARYSVTKDGRVDHGLRGRGAAGAGRGRRGAVAAPAGQDARRGHGAARAPARRGRQEAALRAAAVPGVVGRGRDPPERRSPSRTLRRARSRPRSCSASGPSGTPSRTSA